MPAEDARLVVACEEVALCPSCGGHGWKLVRTRRIFVAPDEPFGSVERPCVDCGGAGVVDEGGATSAWTPILDSTFSIA